MSAIDDVGEFTQRPVRLDSQKVSTESVGCDG